MEPNGAESQFSQPRIYCAGPLFNEAERREMELIADALVDAGYSVYLPHRDGMEFRLILGELVERGFEPATAAQFLHEAIFNLDVFQLAVECEAMVWNRNGRVPDEGAVSEAAIAWTLGKPLVAFRDDVRSLIAGRINPLLAGLTEFEEVERIDEIVDALAAEIDRTPPNSAESVSEKLQTAIERGRRLWDAMRESDASGHDALIADIVTELFAPASPPR